MISDAAVPMNGAVEKLAPVRYYGGFPMSAHHVIAGVKARLEKAA